MGQLFVFLVELTVYYYLMFVCGAIEFVFFVELTFSLLLLMFVCEAIEFVFFVELTVGLLLLMFVFGAVEFVF